MGGGRHGGSGDGEQYVQPRPVTYSPSHPSVVVSIGLLALGPSYRMATGWVNQVASSAWALSCLLPLLPAALPSLPPGAFLPHLAPHLLLVLREELQFLLFTCHDQIRPNPNPTPQLGGRKGSNRVIRRSVHRADA